MKHSIALLVAVLFSLSSYALAAPKSLECKPKLKGENLQSLIITPESDGTYTSEITYKKGEAPRVTTAISFDRNTKFNTVGSYHSYYNYRLALSHSNGVDNLITYQDCSQDPYHIQGCEGGAQEVVVSEVALNCKLKRSSKRK